MMKELLNNLLMNRNQFYRFLFFGLINTAFGYGVYALLVYIGLSYVIANFAALVLGVLFSFKTQGRFVFLNQDNRLLWRFVLAWGGIYLVTIGFIGRVVAMGLDPYTAGAMALPLSTCLSFVFQKYFVFKRAVST